MPFEPPPLIDTLSLSALGHKGDDSANVPLKAGVSRPAGHDLRINGRSYWFRSGYGNSRPTMRLASS